MPDWSTGRGRTKSTSPTSPIRGSGTRCSGRWNSLAQAGNSSRRGTTSNKKPGPSGKVGRGVSTLAPKKTFCYRSIHNSPRNSSSGRGRSCSCRKYDVQGLKPKGRFSADNPSIDQEDHYHCYMERQDHVRSREGSTSVSRDAPI